MSKIQHSPSIKEHVLRQARERGKRSLESIAKEAHVSFGTLKGWRKEELAQIKQLGDTQLLDHTQPNQPWTPAHRLLALHQSHGLIGQELAAWCRKNGTFEHQLIKWRQNFCAEVPPEPVHKQALRALQLENTELQKKLRRKDKALAETAALLVMQKKFQALLASEDA
jgi:hypothetical protein